jgi:hypothetical protein
MLVAILAPVVTVAVGVALAMVGGGRPSVLLPIRSFALAAVVVAVIGHLLPEAIGSGGIAPAIVFVAGLAAGPPDVGNGGDRRRAARRIRARWQPRHPAVHLARRRGRDRRGLRIRPPSCEDAIVTGLRTIFAIAIAAGCSFTRGDGAIDAADPSTPDGPPVDGSTIDGSITMDDAAVDADTTPDAFECTTVGLTCGGTLSTFTCGGDCWAGCASGVDHATAHARCIAWGGVLAEVDNMTEQDCLDTTFVPAGAMHLGIVQPGGQTSPTAGWVWESTGATPVYTHWSGGQPSDNDGVESGEEQCAYLSNGSGTWHDTPCSFAASGFACRKR